MAKVCTLYEKKEESPVLERMTEANKRQIAKDIEAWKAKFHLTQLNKKAPATTNC